MKKTIEIITIVLFTAMIATFGVLHIALPDAKLSESERRSLAQFPEFTTQTVKSGTFMQNLEKYLPDQFPLREGWRSIKGTFEILSGRSDSSDIYEVDGYLTKLEYKLNESSIVKAGAKLEKIRELLGCENAYVSVIPQKSHFMNDKVHPIQDFDRMCELLYSAMPSFEAIDISDTLSLDSYYKTDSHWRQEKLEGTVNKLVTSMGLNVTVPEYEINEITDFKGVFAGQYAMPIEAESIFYLTSDVIENVTVSAIADDMNEIYTLGKLEDERSLDMYDIFLGGAVPLITIENENSQTDNKLVIVRDSFGSSITPLLVDYYSKITVIDLRYIASVILPQYVDADGADLLVMLSPGILNDSEMLRVQ